MKYPPSLRGGLRGRCLRGTTTAFDAFFDFLEGGPNVARDGPAREFHGYRGRGAFHEADHHDAEHVIVGVFFFAALSHVSGDGADESVAEQNSQEGPYQRGGNFVTDFFGRAAE